MRVWVPLNAAAIESVLRSQPFGPESAYGLTQHWVSTQEDDDPEVLEDELLYVAGAQFKALAVCEANAVESETSLEVSLEQPISPRQIVALFARQSLDDDFSWFGPTEIESFNDFLHTPE